MSILIQDLIYILIAGIIISFAKSIQDELTFYYDQSIFYTWKHNKWFGDPMNTWTNKDFSSNLIIKWIFNGPLVFTTDAWHFFDFIRNFTLPTILSFMIGHPLWALWYYLIFTCNFTIFFNYLWKKNNKTI